MKKTIKVLLLMALSVVLAVSLAGCSKENLNDKPGENDPKGGSSQNGSIDPADNSQQKDYNGVTARVLSSDFPTQIETYLLENKLNETQQAFNIDNRTYIVLTMGEQTSGGYAIELQDLVLGDGTLKVFVKYVKPGKDDMTATVMTYPSLVIETDKIYEGHYEIEYEIEK